METSAKIANGLKPLHIVAKLSILNVYTSFAQASDTNFYSDLRMLFLIIPKTSYN